MIKDNENYDNDKIVDDVYLGELASRIAQHERAESDRTRRLIEEQERTSGRIERLPIVNPSDVQ